MGGGDRYPQGLSKSYSIEINSGVLERGLSLITNDPFITFISEIPSVLGALCQKQGRQNIHSLL